MKVNDKLYCKKDYICEYNGRIHNFSKGNIYTINYIVNKFHMNLYCIDDDNCNSLTFSLNKEHKLYLWNYFYSPEDIRLKKLKSL